jgi:FkbM family methyltransferase
MHLVSSAQNQEDIMLWRALRNVTEGFYIDVGAADPYTYSVTRVFYDRGWRGINLEPSETYFPALRLARPGDINLAIAAGRTAGQQIFHDVGDSGLSTFDSEIAAKHQSDGMAVTTRTVETLPLAEICRRYRPEGPIHFLKIDVEGGEGDVLAGADFDAFRPWIVVVEATLPGSQVESHGKWEELLLRHGYSFVWFDGLNRYYLSDEMKPDLERHFRVPPNVFDGFESAASLLDRLNRAEAETVEAQLRASDVGAEVAELAERLKAVSRALDETRLSLDLTNKQLLAGRQELAHMSWRAGVAEERMTFLLASTSWRITAPLRIARRLLPGAQADGASPPTVLAAAGQGLARRVLHRGMRLLLATPGARRVSRIILKIAPGPVELLARRYRTDEWRQITNGQAQAVSVLQAAGPMIFPADLPDLSEAEGLLYRQFATADRSTNGGAATHRFTAAP